MRELAKSAAFCWLAIAPAVVAAETVTLMTQLQWEAVEREGAEYRELLSEAGRAIQAQDAVTAWKSLDRILAFCASKTSPLGGRVVSVSTVVEFDSYMASLEEGATVVWVDMVCPGAYKAAAFLRVAAGQNDDALRFLDLAQTLAPYWAEPLAERGYILNELHEPKPALAAYEAALDLAQKHESSAYVMPMALRGIGFTLIELGDLDGAEAALKRSLQVEPGNELALHELEYVNNLRSKSP